MTERPNILWICTDQQRYDTIGALGNPHIHTPNIDRLVGEGLAFTHAYCQNPICTPSRASFLTGMYPSSVHACMNGNDRWADAAPLVTKLLADAGYDCGLAGKLHLSGAAGRIEPRPDDGYRVFHWSHHPYDDWDEGHDYADWLRAQGNDPSILFEDPASDPALPAPDNLVYGPGARLHCRRTLTALADERQLLRSPRRLRSATALSGPLRS